MTHLLIVFHSYFTTMPGCGADVPAFMFVKFPEKIAKPPCAPCTQNLDLRLRCALTKIKPKSNDQASFPKLDELIWKR